MNRSLRNIIFMLFTFFSSNTDAQTWYKVDKGLSYFINNLYADTANNLLYVCGNFELALDTIQCNGIGVWNGSNWSTLAPNLNIPCGGWVCGQPVNSVTPFDSSVFAVGILDTDTTKFYIRRWNGSSWIISGRSNGWVRTLHIANNELFALGTFDSIENVPVNHIAKWNGNGWDSFGDTTSIFDGWTPTVIKYINGNYYIGGNFSGHSGMKEIVKWNGVQWSAMLNGILGNSWVLDIQEYKNYIFVCGHFYQSSGNPADFVMAWDGTQWIDPFPNVQYLSQVWDMDVIDNQLYIAGDYQIAGDTGIYGLARYDGTNFCAFGGVGIYPKYYLEAMNDTLYVSLGDYVLFGDSVNYIVRTPLTTPNQICSYMPLSTDITEEFSLLNVFPNPSTDIINIAYPGKEKLSVTVYSLDGKIVYNLSRTADSNPVSISVSELPDGMYFISVSYLDQIRHSKFIKH